MLRCWCCWCWCWWCWCRCCPSRQRYRENKFEYRLFFKWNTANCFICRDDNEQIIRQFERAPWWVSPAWQTPSWPKNAFLSEWIIANIYNWKGQPKMVAEFKCISVEMEKRQNDMIRSDTTNQQMVWFHCYLTTVAVVVRCWLRQRHQWCQRWQTVATAMADG